MLTEANSPRMTETCNCGPKRLLSNLELWSEKKKNSLKYVYTRTYWVEPMDNEEDVENNVSKAVLTQNSLKYVYTCMYWVEQLYDEEDVE